MRQKNVLIVTAVAGFLCQFEKNTVGILRRAGARIHYASDFDFPAYEFDEEYFAENEIKVHPLSIRKSPVRIRDNFRALAELVRIIRREEIHVVHCHNPVGGVLGRLAAWLSAREVKVIYTAHGFHFYKGGPLKSWFLFYPVERALARMTDVLVTINREDRSCAGRFILKKGGQVAFMPGTGTDTDRFCPDRSRRQEARQVMGVKEEEYCLVTAARLDREKNCQTVLRAMEELGDIPCRYVICGEGPWRPFLEREVRRRGLEDRVRLMGFRRDMDFLLQGADLFLFPSLREGLGMAALEAMACGLPVVAADSRGTREYVRQGENGFLCGGRKPGEFAWAVRALWQGKDLRAAMGREARRMSLQFSRQRAEEKMKEIYRSIGVWGEEAEDEEKTGYGEETGSQRHHECVRSQSFLSA